MSVTSTEISSPTRARQRLQGTNDQAAYINNHSVISLLNDLLVSVVEQKPEDVLTFLVDHLTQLQVDVTRARQLLERKNRGTNASPINEADRANNEEHGHVDQAVAASESEEAATTTVAHGTTAAEVAPMSSKTKEPSVTSQRATGLKRLIEVRVDGEVRMIPDVEDDEGVESFQTKQVESVPSVSRVLSGVATQRTGAEEVLPLSPSTTLIVQEPTAVRYLLKAAERQKTPFLSMLVDHARTKAAALSADDGDLSHKSPLSLSTVLSPSDNSKLTAHHSQPRARRGSPLTTSYLGIELLQRSSSGDQFPSLSLLNNHWMVRRQIVIAVEENGDVSRTYSPVPPEARPEEAPGQADRTASSPPHSSAVPSSAVVPQSPQRAILVQDPTPIRLLLRASERQLTPSLSILIDFARKRYRSNVVHAPSSSSSKDVGGTSSSPTSGVVTNANMLGIELLHRSNAHCSGLKALGILSNHWMVRRQIVVAVKPKENSEN